MPIVKETATIFRRPAKFWWIISGVAAVLVCVAGAGVYFYWKSGQNKLPNPQTQPQESWKFVGSDKFKKMPLAERKQYFKKLGGWKGIAKNWKSFTPEEQKAIRQSMRSIGRQEQAQKMQKFFAADRATQNKMLDADIARMRQFQQQRARRQQANAAAASGTKKAAARPGYRGISPQNRRDWEARSNPAERAQRQLYWRMMQERMAGKR